MSPSGYGGSVIGPDPMIPPGKQGIYEQSLTQKALLGQIIHLGDGRAFTYARAGGTLEAAAHLASGKNCHPIADVDLHLDLATVVAGAVGGRTVSVTLGATLATVNMYAEGYLCVVDAGSEGIYYKIKSHPAADASASLAIKLYDEIVEAIAVGTDVISLTRHAYDQAEVSASQALQPLGVPLKDVKGQYYCWLQTWGHAMVWVDEAATDGAPVTQGANDAGGSEDMDGAAEHCLGHYRCGVSGAQDYGPVYLRIQR